MYNKQSLPSGRFRESDERFLRCHQSYFVNLQYVAGVVDSDFIMLNDCMIPIRKSGRKLIVKKYEEYLKENSNSTCHRETAPDSPLKPVCPEK